MTLRNKASRVLPPASSPSPLPIDPTSDIIVLVMGIVGAGRSTFVNALLSKCSSQLDRMEVGDKLDPCTITAKHSIIPSEDLTRILGYEAKYRLVLVDTPGFDAGNQTDSDGVLREIMSWSRSRLPDDQKCRGGVIFMHDITADRFQGQEDLTILGSVFNAPSASPRLVVVTSKWKVMNRSDAESRHKLLVDRFKKATFHRFQEDEDAWEIMKQLLPQIERGAMLDFGKEFSVIRARKRQSEELYQKKKRSTFSKLFRFLMFWKRG